MTVRFAVIGVNHDHIFGQARCLTEAGAEFVAWWGDGQEDHSEKCRSSWSGVPQVDDLRRILEDDTVALVCCASTLDERTPMAIEIMRHGKDVMLDKPGAVSLDQLADLRRVQQETGRIVSICYSEHFETRATVKAGELVAAGAIGKVIATAGFGPHRLRKPTRPSWFFQRERYGGILTDIASHQCEQFLFFTGDRPARILSAVVANRANPATPGLQDVGEIHLATDDAFGFIHVDWFTPDGMPIWGDGRLMLTGTEGHIELRKYIDIAGRPGGDHLFLSDRTGVRHIDCSDVALPYGAALIADVQNRTETAMPQARCFAAMELALTAQKMAEQ